MKHMVNKIICAFCALILPLSVFASCGNKSKDSSDGKISIVATNFPQYDWALNIIGDSPDISLSLLADNGTDLHSFEPTADDIITISECDIFIYIGGESDRWVEDALSQALNKDMIKLNLLECLGDKAQHAEAGAAHSHDDCDDDCTHIYDEHVWLSLKNAKLLCEKIAESIISLCPDSKDTLTQNLNDYIGRINALDEEYTRLFETSSGKPLIFADRFPFLYMHEDYSFEYYAAFAGCTSESEASFDTITFLAEKLDLYDIDAVITLKGSKNDVANAVIKASKSQNAQIYQLDSMQSVTKNDINSGADYLLSMENNLSVLQAALS